MVLFKLDVEGKEYHISLPVEGSYQMLMESLESIFPYDSPTSLLLQWQLNGDVKNIITNEEEFREFVYEHRCNGREFRLKGNFFPFEAQEFSSTRPITHIKGAFEYKECESNDIDGGPPGKVRRTNRRDEVFEDCVFQKLAFPSAVRQEDIGNWKSLVGVDIQTEKARDLEYLDNQPSVDSLLEMLEDVLACVDTKPPILVSRMAKGGKTTILRALSSHLIHMGILPVMISFRGFKKRGAESLCRALVRLISSTLMDFEDNDDVSKLSVNIRAVELLIETRYNAEFIGKARRYHHCPCVLILDDFQCFSTSLDDDSFAFLKQLFFDRYGRAMIYSATKRYSLRPGMGYLRFSKFPFISLAPTKRSVSTSQFYSTMSHNIIAYFGAVPSLLNSIVMTRFRPTKALGAYLNSIRTGCCLLSLNADDRSTFMKGFLETVLTGCLSDEKIAIFERFATIDEGECYIWPICYISLIIKTFSDHPVANAFYELVQMLKLSGGIDGKLDWKLLLRMGIVLRCLAVQYGNQKVPLLNVSLGALNAKGFVIDHHFLISSTPYISFDVAKQTVHEILSTTSTQRVVLFSPSPAVSIDCFDGLLAYRAHPNSWTIVGYQVCIGVAPYTSKFPSWIAKGYIFTDISIYVDRTDGNWVCLGLQQLVDVLGYSLSIFVRPAARLYRKVQRR